MDKRSVLNIHKTVLSLLKDGKNRKILDLGCGNGDLSNDLYKLGFDVIPCDAYLSDIRKKHPHIKCKFADLNKDFPFDNNEFDYAVALELIEHLENPWYFFREVNRVVKPRGKFILTTPNIENYWSRLVYFLVGKFPLFTKVHETTDTLSIDKGHISLVPLWLIKKMVRETQFEIEKTTYNRAGFCLTISDRSKLIQKILLKLPKTHKLGEN